ncbi:porin family protein [Parasediminibacterium sp. JCM 36343]|uniref:type IX secretion/gliding motility protein PorT/SprT n=1 Tax=Parasediminibacterium sp. JCM 36343 TaxID=3374279 RepID=UPI003979DD88
MHHLLRKQIRLLAFVAACIASFSAMAQEKEINRAEHDDLPYYFGITLGYNSSYLHANKSSYFLKQDSILSAQPGSGGGITLGFVGTLKLNDHFQFRLNPQLVLGGGKYFTYTLNPNRLRADRSESLNTQKTLPSTLLSMPIQIKFNSDRIDNFRFYALGGIRLDKDLSSNSAARNAEDLIKLSGNDFGLETGLGCNFFLKFVTISPELKFSYGLTNIHARDPNLKYSAIFDKIQSRMISFSIHFED